MARALLILSLVALLAVACAGHLMRPPNTVGRSPAQGGPTLQRVVFAHRHGARTPMVPLNGTCDVLGCGTLTIEGARMLHALGESFHARYGAILPSWVDTQRFKVVSDESDRVIQSAAAFLDGLYAYNASYTPLQITNTDKVNLMDPWNGQMGFALHQVPFALGAFKNLSDAVVSIIPVEALSAVAQEIGLPGIACDIVPLVCAAAEVDFLDSMNSEGSISRYPLGQQYFPQLGQARQSLYRNLEGVYDTQVLRDDYFTQAGWPGASLLMAMLDDAANDKLVLSEFSGHDISLMPLWAAMGNLTFSYPGFATAMVFEVSMSTQASKVVTGSNTSALFVQPFVAIVADPASTTNYEIVWTPYAMTCETAAGTLYTTEAGCPYDDVHRYALSRVGPTGGASGVNPCYAWPRDLDFASCTPDKPADAKTACGKYRAACPFSACGAGYYMTADLACHAISQ